ncbi:hypothetical protein [Ferrimonas gelatinilytica]|uniref:Nuclear transport factor 2 family protein n=1 Tax=Ferrimonas gelatinilytica TaxID=1255257 RepID=A0ABP9SF96_9GAMM
MRALFFAFFILSFGVQSAEYQDDIDKFFDLYSSGKVNEAVDTIYSSNSYVSAIPDQIKNIKTQLSALEGLVGSIQHINRVDTFSVGELLVQVTYIVTYARQPVRFEFQFFKVKDGWRTYSFSFDDEIDEEIKAAARKALLIQPE